MGLVPGVGDALSKGLKVGAKAVEKMAGAKIFRRGTFTETASRLDRKAKEAAAEGFPHGVSGSKSELGPDSSVATRENLEANGFPVHDTGTTNNPDHVTIEMPDPVTKDDAARFNACFGRDNCK